MGLERRRGQSTLVPLDVALKQIPKKVWHIRRPYRSWQWTFLFGTNWDTPFRLARQHFYDLCSSEGQSILRRLSKNREEVHEQYDLFSA